MISKEANPSPLAAAGKVLVVLSVFAAAGCSKESALREHVVKSCSLLAVEVERAAQKYEEFSAWASGRTPDDTWNRQELSLPCRWRIESRGACGVQLATRIQFCIDAKKGDPKSIGELADRAAAALDRFSVSSDPSAVAAATRELSTITSSMNQLETRK